MKAFFLILAASVSGTTLLAYAEGPYPPQEATLPLGTVERVIGAVVFAGGTIEAARRMAHSAKLEARAADQRATAIGRKHDELQRQFHDEIARRSGWEGEVRGSHNALEKRVEVVAHANHDTRTELGGRIIRLEDRFEAFGEK